MKLFEVTKPILGVLELIEETEDLRNDVRILVRELESGEILFSINVGREAYRATCDPTQYRKFGALLSCEDDVERIRKALEEGGILPPVLAGRPEAGEIRVAALVVLARYQERKEAL